MTCRLVKERIMLLSEITWVKAEEYFRHNDMVIIPIGSIECHGKHMPLGTDTLIPDKIIELVRKQNDDILIAPTMPYGACESLYPFPGTVNLGTDLLYQLMKTIIWNLKLERIGYELDSEGCMMALLNWWLNVWELNPAWKGGHGGGEETAGVLAVNPDLVDRKYVDDPLVLKDVSPAIKASGFNSAEFRGVNVTIPRLTDHVTDNGWIGPDHPKYATKEWGDEMLQAFADYMVSFLEEFSKVEL